MAPGDRKRRGSAYGPLLAAAGAYRALVGAEKAPRGAKKRKIGPLAGK